MELKSKRFTVYEPRVARAINGGCSYRAVAMRTGYGGGKIEAFLIDESYLHSIFRKSPFRSNENSGVFSSIILPMKSPTEYT